MTPEQRTYLSRAVCHTIQANKLLLQELNELLEIELLF